MGKKLWRHLPKTLTNGKIKLERNSGEKKKVLETCNPGKDSMTQYWWSVQEVWNWAGGKGRHQRDWKWIEVSAIQICSRKVVLSLCGFKEIGVLIWKARRREKGVEGIMTPFKCK